MQPRNGAASGILAMPSLESSSSVMRIAEIADERWTVPEEQNRSAYCVSEQEAMLGIVALLSVSQVNADADAEQDDVSDLPPVSRAAVGTLYRSGQCWYSTRER